MGTNEEFGVPNGQMQGVETDFISDPDVEDKDPFDKGVEHSDHDEIQSFRSTVGREFQVDECGDDEIIENIDDLKPLAFEDIIEHPVIGDDPSVMEEPEESPSLDDLDDQAIIAGDFEYADDGVGNFSFDDSKIVNVDYSSVLEHDYHMGEDEGSYNSCKGWDELIEELDEES